MKIAILGSGGREHALTFSISKSNKIEKIYCIPGNAGTSELAENISLDINDFKTVYEFLKKNNVDFVVVGPEEPLVNGIVDYLEKFNVKIFGPNKVSSQLEGSKIFTKKLCKKYNIPTAKFGIFKNADESYRYINNAKHPLVIKADNLAAGKGVYICREKAESYLAVKEIFDGKFGTAKNILFEEFLEGEEMSYFIISDGVTFKYFGSAQDHKRVGEGDMGKNTGGMGAYSPSRLFNEKLERKILEKIIKPTLKGINDLGTKYVGFLYAGLMIIKDEPFLIEYNVRMGDPECQTILPKLKTDFAEIIEACVKTNLENIELDWYNDKSICVVLCSKGYPDSYKNNIEINNLNKIILKNNEFIFHAGTKKKEDKIFSNGGRVLNFVVRSKDFIDCRKKAISLINDLKWDNGFFRKDIGYKVISE